MCRTETILNTKHRAIGSRDRQGPWGKEGRQRLYYRPVRKNKGRNPKRISSGSSSLHLPQKQRLNLHFSHTILPRVVLSPQPQSRSSCQNTSTTQLRRLPLPVTSARFRTQPSRSGLSRMEKVAGGINASSWAGLPLSVRLSSSTIGYPLVSPRLLVCACARGHGSPSHLRVGGGGVPFPSAGGRVR